MASRPLKFTVERDINYSMGKHGREPDHCANHASARGKETPEIGQPVPADRQRLKRAGLLVAASDLLWIPQAGLIALALGTVFAALPNEPTSAGFSANLIRQTIVFAACFAGLALVRAGLQYLGARLARQAARELQSRTRAELLAAASKTSPAEPFPSSGAFAAHISEQVDLLGPYYRNYVPQLPRLKIVPLAIVLVTLWHSWLAALILLVCGPVIPLFMALIGMRAQAASAGQQEELTRLSGVLLDRIKGLETLELFGALERTRKDVAEAGERFRKGTMSVLKIAFLSSTVLELFSALGIAFSAVFIGFTLLGDLSVGTWGQPLGYSAGLFVLLLAPEFFAPIRAYAAAYHDRAAGLAAQEKLASLLQRPSAKGPSRCSEAFQDPAEAQATPAIHVKDLKLELAGTLVFENFDLDIAPGETVFLTGRSGSGKTSLLDCLLGFHLPQSGIVQIDGSTPRQLGNGLLQSVAWLDQTPRLFHGSLKSNLLRGTGDTQSVTDADLWGALQLAGAKELVERLPNGFATQLGEDGFGLSVGEIRRIALARAAMRKDAGLLLADEPTAALDRETAGLVIKGLEKLAVGRTTIIATHDPAVLALPGRVVELEKQDMRAVGEGVS